MLWGVVFFDASNELEGWQMASGVRTIVVDGERVCMWVVELVRSRVFRKGRVLWAEIVEVKLVGVSLN